MEHTPDPRRARWTTVHERAAMTGWDFSALDGRLIAADPPWDFEEICVDHLRCSRSCLDMGTGGGERLISLIGRLAADDEASARRRESTAHRLSISATEGWAPNIPLATSALAPYSIEVREYDSESGCPIPWPDESFDIVMNRHEGYDPKEVARIIRPGGRFLTQQVDGTEAQELRDWFGGEPMYPDARLEVARADLESEGFAIADARDWSGVMVFADVETMLEYLGYVPWDVPGFTVEANLGRLEELAELRSPIEVTQKRFLIIAEKQGPTEAPR